MKTREALVLVVVLLGCRKPAASVALAQDTTIPASAADAATTALVAIRCAPELDSVGTLPTSRLPRAQRDWSAGRDAPAQPVTIELARTRTGTAAIVLRTSDDKRCDRFVRGTDGSAGPFFGFAGSTPAWRVQSYIGVGDFANLLVAVADDHGDIRALYEHEHNVNMDADFKLARLDVGGAFIPFVWSSSGGDGQTGAFAELFGLSASGEPQRLLEIDGAGPTPHAIAEPTVRMGGAVPQIEAVTSKGKGPDCFTRDCLVCSKSQYAWNAKSATFQRAGGAAPAACP